MSSSLPLSRETPSEPFGCPRFLPEALVGALGNQVTLDLGEQREEGGHDFGLDVALALDANVLLQRHEGDTCLGEGVEDGDDLTQRRLSNRFSVISCRACREGFLHLFFPAGQVEVLPAG